MDIPLIYKNTINSRNSRRELSPILAEYDLVYGEFEILFLLSNDQPLRPSRIGIIINCEPASISRLIKILFQKSLITYNHGIEDRRQVLIELTKDGNSLIKSVMNHNCN